VFDILLMLIIVFNISFIATLIRLRVKHKDVFEQLELNGMLFGSIKQVARLIDFFVKKKQTDLNDSFLIVTGYTFIGSFVIGLPYMLIYLLFFRN